MGFKPITPFLDTLECFEDKDTHVFWYRARLRSTGGEYVVGFIELHDRRVVMHISPGWVQEAKENLEAIRKVCSPINGLDCFTLNAEGLVVSMGETLERLLQ